MPIDPRSDCYCIAAPNCVIFFRYVKINSNNMILKKKYCIAAQYFACQHALELLVWLQHERPHRNLGMRPDSGLG